MFVEQGYVQEKFYCTARMIILRSNIFLCKKGLGLQNLSSAILYERSRGSNLVKTFTCSELLPSAEYVCESEALQQVHRVPFEDDFYLYLYNVTIYNAI